MSYLDWTSLYILTYFGEYLKALGDFVKGVPNLQKSASFILPIWLHVGHSMLKGLAEIMAFYENNIVGVSEWEGSEKILHGDVALVKSCLDAAGIDDCQSGSIFSISSVGPNHRIGDKVS